MLTLKRMAFVLILLGMSSTVNADDHAHQDKKQEKSPAVAESRGSEQQRSPAAEKPAKSLNDDQMLAELQSTLESEDFSVDP